VARAFQARVGGPKRAALHVALVAVLGISAQPPAAPPDTIFVNGHVITVDARFSIAEAVAITGGKFSAVGTNAAIRKLAGPKTATIDLHGQTVIPGLADGHLHDAGGGPGADLSGARNLADILSAVAARVKQSRPGDVIVSNSDWHEAQLTEHRLPYRADLDAVSPANPVVLVRGGHEYILNSAALRKWNITKETPQQAGGRITRDAKGELNGELIDRAKSLVQLPPSPPLTIEALVEQHKKLNAAGLTSIRYPGASIEQYRLLEEMKRRGLLTIRVNQLMRVPADTAEKMRAAVAALNVKPDEGDEWLRVGGMKLGVDGGFEGGWMRQPYVEPWGEGGTFYGVNTMKQAPYTDVVKELNRLGWRVATHAVGDAAIDEVITAYEAANAEKSIVGRRWVLEHGFIAQPDQFARLKKLDLVISAQDHLYLAGPSLVNYWGPVRAARTTPMRAFIDQGFVVAGGTDSAVVPYPPMWVIYHFVTRDTISGGVLGADQKITRKEALQVETINNAYLTFEERIKGSIEPGKLADLVVLPEDILTCAEKHIEQMHVSMTMVGGIVVYRGP
ncbi:MAG TPA: amidohydrolase, partial [Vicinamibacterales bacterium]|nr:amidohydrolase [Vicinamibacterales bacterium]